MKKALFLAMGTTLVGDIVSMRTFPSGMPEGTRSGGDVSNLSSTRPEIYNGDGRRSELSGEAAPDVTESTSRCNHRVRRGAGRNRNSERERPNFFDIAPEGRDEEVGYHDEVSSAAPDVVATPEVAVDVREYRTQNMRSHAVPEGIRSEGEGANSYSVGLREREEVGHGGGFGSVVPGVDRDNGIGSYDRYLRTVELGGFVPENTDPYIHYIRNVRHCWCMCRSDVFLQEISDMTRYLASFRYAPRTDEIDELRSNFELLRKRLCILLCYGMTEDQFEKIVSFFCGIYRKKELKGVKSSSILRPLYERFTYVQDGWNFVTSLLSWRSPSPLISDSRRSLGSIYGWLRSAFSSCYLLNDSRRSNSVCKKFEAFIRCRLTDVIYSFFNSKVISFEIGGDLQKNEIGPMLMSLNPWDSWNDFLRFYTRVRSDFDSFRQRMEEGAALLSSSDEENPVRIGTSGGRSPGRGGISPTRRSPSEQQSKKKKKSARPLASNISPKRSVSESRGGGSPSKYSPFGGSKTGGMSPSQTSPLERQDKKKKSSVGFSIGTTTSPKRSLSEKKVSESPSKHNFSAGLERGSTSPVKRSPSEQKSKNNSAGGHIGTTASPKKSSNEKKASESPSKHNFSAGLERGVTSPMRRFPSEQKSKNNNNSVGGHIGTTTSPKRSSSEKKVGELQPRYGVSSDPQMRGRFSQESSSKLSTTASTQRVSPVSRSNTEASNAPIKESDNVAKPKLSKKGKSKAEKRNLADRNAGKEIRKGVPNEGVGELREELERRSAVESELREVIRNSESERGELVRGREDLEKKLGEESEARELAQKQKSELEGGIRSNENERADLVRKQEDLEKKLKEESEARKQAQKRESELEEVIRNNESMHDELLQKQKDLEKRLEEESKARKLAQKQRFELEKGLQEQKEDLGKHFEEEKRLREQAREQEIRLEELKQKQELLEKQVAEKTKQVQKQGDELKKYAENESKLRKSVQKHQREAEVRSKEDAQYRELAQKREAELEGAMRRQQKEFEEQIAEKADLEKLLKERQDEIKKHSEEEARLREALQKRSKELDSRVAEKLKLEESLKRMQGGLERYSEEEGRLKSLLSKKEAELEALSKKGIEVQRLLNEHRKSAELGSKKEMEFRETAQKREAEIKETIQKQKVRIENHATEKARLEKSLQEQKERLKKSSEQRAELEKSLQDQDELRKQVAEKTKLLQEKESEIRESSERETKLNESLQKQKVELEKHTAKRLEFEKLLQDQQEELRKRSEEDDKLRETLRKQQKELEGHVAEKTELERSVKKQQEDLRECSNREIKLKKLLEDQKKMLEAQEAEKVKLEESLRNREEELDRGVKKEAELRNLLKEKQKEMDVYSEEEAFARKKELEFKELLEGQRKKFEAQEAERLRLEKLLKEREEELNQRVKKEAELVESFQSQKKELDERVAKELELKNTLQAQQEELIRRSSDDAKVQQHQKEFENVLAEKDRLGKLIQEQSEKLDEHLKEEERLKELARIQKENADKALKEREDELESLRLFRRETEAMHSRALDQFSEILSGYATGLGDLVGSLKDSKSRSARRLLGDACIEVFGTVGSPGDFMDRFRDNFISAGSGGVVDSLLGFASSLSRVNNILADAFIRGVPASPSLRRSRSVSLLPMQKKAGSFSGSNVEYEGNVSSSGFVNGRIRFFDDGMEYFLDVDFRSFIWSDVSISWEDTGNRNGANFVFQNENFNFPMSPAELFDGFNYRNVYYADDGGMVFVLGNAKEMKSNATCLIFSRNFIFLGEVERKCGKRKLFEISMGGRAFYKNVFPEMMMVNGTISTSSRSVSCVGKIKLKDFIESFLNGGLDEHIMAGGDPNRGITLHVFQRTAPQLSPKAKSLSDDEDSLAAIEMSPNVSETGTPRLARVRARVSEVTPPRLRDGKPVLPLSPSMVGDGFADSLEDRDNGGGNLTANDNNNNSAEADGSGSNDNDNDNNDKLDENRNEN